MKKGGFSGKIKKTLIGGRIGIIRFLLAAVFLGLMWSTLSQFLEFLGITNNILKFVIYLILVIITKKIFDVIDEKIFLEVLRKIKSNPSLFFCMLLFDAMFLLSIYSANKIVGVFSEGRIILPIYALAYMAVYFLIFVALYSFFKYSILHFIKSMFEKDVLDFDNFGKFYLLNIILLFVFAIIFLLLSAIVPLIIAQDYQKLILRIMLILFLFFSYAILNLCHSYFINKKKIRCSLSSAFNSAFKKLPSYMPVFLGSMFFLVIYFLIYMLIGYILKYTLFSKPVPLHYNTLYNLVFSIATITVFYLINAFNRIYFYLILQKTKGE